MASLAGTSGRFEPELVASLNRNKWQNSPEYAAYGKPVYFSSRWQNISMQVANV